MAPLFVSLFKVAANVYRSKGLIPHNIVIG